MAIKIKDENQSKSSSSGDKSGSSGKSKTTIISYRDLEGQSLSYPGSDFIEVVEAPETQIWMIFGEGGTGKTTFCARYCPAPVAIINLDYRGDEVARKENKKNHKVILSQIECLYDLSELDIDEAKEESSKVVARFLLNWNWCLRNSNQKGAGIKTIVIDTGTELSAYVKTAYAGREDMVNDFGSSKNQLNQFWLRIFARARQMKINLMVLSRSKPVYTDDKDIKDAAKGVLTWRCNETVYDMVDCALNVRWRKSLVPGRNKKKIEVEITKAGLNSDILNNVYNESDWGDIGPFEFISELNIVKKDDEDDEDDED